MFVHHDVAVVFSLLAIVVSAKRDFFEESFGKDRSRVCDLLQFSSMPVGDFVERAEGLVDNLRKVDLAFVEGKLCRRGAYKLLPPRDVCEDEVVANEYTIHIFFNN